MSFLPVPRLRLTTSSAFLLFLIFSPAAAQVAKETVAARNMIVGGDYSTNIIAEGNSRVYVISAENGQKINLDEEQFLSFLQVNEDELVSKVRNSFRDRDTYFVQRAAAAEFMFKEGQYSLSASLYDELLDEMSAGDEQYNRLEGMATASFYGSARHLQGLRFICERYQFRPRWSFRYRHAVHAHVRAIVAHLGHERAEQTLDAVRRDPRCDRADFTNAWIPIHLRDMRALEAGTPYWNWRYGPSSPEDAAYIDRLLAENDQGFLDYVHFILGDFETIIDEFPNSYIRDLALLGVGWRAGPDEAIPALEEYLEKFPQHRAEARTLLMGKVQEKGDAALLADYFVRYPDADANRAYIREFSLPLNVSETVRVWIGNRNVKTLSFAERQVVADYYSSCGTFREQFENGDFERLEETLRHWQSRYADHFSIDLQLKGYFAQRSFRTYDYGGICLIDFNSGDLKTALNVITPVAKAMRAFDDQALAAFGRLFKLCGDERDGKREETRGCRQLVESIALRAPWVSFHRTGANLLKQAFDLSGAQDDRSLFLSGLAFRAIGDFESMAETMQLYADTFPDGDFADDALTELGWIELTISQNPRAADVYFERVLDQYPDRNAYDNALNWMIISKRMAGHYIQAAGLSAQLLANIASERIRPKAVARHREILYAADLVGESPEIRIGERFDGVEYYGFALTEDTDVFIAESAYRQLPQGAKVKRVMGVEVTDANDLFTIVDRLKSSGVRTAAFEILLPGGGNKRAEIDVPVEILIKE